MARISKRQTFYSQNSMSTRCTSFPFTFFFFLFLFWLCSSLLRLSLTPFFCFAPIFYSVTDTHLFDFPFLWFALSLLLSDFVSSPPLPWSHSFLSLYTSILPSMSLLPSICFYPVRLLLPTDYSTDPITDLAINTSILLIPRFSSNLYHLSNLYSVMIFLTFNIWQSKFDVAQELCQRCLINDNSCSQV